MQDVRANGEPAIAGAAMGEPGLAGDSRIPPGRLTGWLAVVGAYAGLAYLLNFTSDGDTPEDVLYRWETAVGALFLYGLILGVMALLSRGVDRGLLGLRRPHSWPRAIGMILGAFVVVMLIGAALSPFLDAGEEQGIVPDRWEPDRVAPFVANVLVVVALGPIVEEFTYRGLGFAVTRDRWGVPAAIGVTAAAFGLAHGLLVALPILTVFGVILAAVRERSGSLYPPILLHALFNGFAILVAVTIGTGS